MSELLKAGRFKASVVLGFFTVSILWFFYLTFQYYWIFGGDPEIHIVFAKNFLTGHVLEFNPGFKSGGETSPVYMMLVASIMAFMGVYVPYGMKAVSFTSFALLIYLLYRASYQAGNVRRLLFILLAAGLPFLQLQAYLGMENILFALIVLWVVTLHVRGKLSIGLLFCGLPVLFFLRPEAVFVYAWMMALCLFQGRYRVLVGAAVSLMVTFVLYKSLNSYAGVDTHSAGMIRRFLSGLTAVKLDFGEYSLSVSTVAVVRMLYVVPVLLLIILYRRALAPEDKITLLVLVILPAALHIFNILPNFHFARYFIFEFVVLFHVFASRVLTLVPMHTLILVLWLPFMTMSVVEHYSRLMKFSNAAHTVVALKEESIRKYSDYLVLRLGDHQTPIVIASQEVQIRARLDNRFLVWSLDGVTDNRLANSLGSDHVDHFSYIKDRDIRYIFTPVEYTSNPDQKTLLSFFNAGVLDEGLCLEGISLSSTAIHHVFKVNRCS